MKKAIALTAMLLAVLFVSGCANDAGTETMFFGSYEQDNDLSNGPEPIEWIVLHKDSEKTLLLAKDILEYLPYNEAYDSVSLVYWPDATLRAWLGGEFYETAFTEAEQERILETTLPNEVERYNFYSAGEDTQETVFLLSRDEVDKYLHRTTTALAKPSAYALAKGVRVNSQGDAKWWLRSFGDEDHAYYVTDFGSICKRGFYIYYYDLSEVRPAVWITNE